MRAYLGESNKAKVDAIKLARKELKNIKIKEEALNEIQDYYNIFIKTGKIPFEKDFILM